MRGRHVWRAAILALAPVVTLTGAARANHIRAGFGEETQPPGSVVIQTTPQVAGQPALPPVVVQPGQQVIVQPAQPSTVVTQPSVVVPAPQMVQAEDLEANEVRAHTIYANKIEAADVRGSIHPTGGVKLDKTVRDLKAPTVVASLLYADTIKAHRVVADHIFVRDLQRR